MHPILLLGLALGAGLAYSKRSSTPAVKPDSGLIDASEKAHPNAELARKAILNALSVKSMTLYEMTAVAIDTQLRMPRTAANLRAYAQMAKQAGATIAGDDDDDEVGGSEGYGDDDEVSGSDGYGDDDEVGARKRRVKKLFKSVTAAKKVSASRSSSLFSRVNAVKRLAAKPAATPAPAATKKKKRRKKRARVVSPALAAAVAAPSVATVLAAANAPPAPAPSYGYGYGAGSSPSVDWSSATDDEGEDGDGDDEGGSDEGAGDDDDEVGASSRRKKLPEWLRFNATQSALAGDPALIKATATVMRRMGYAEHADFHLRALSR